MKNLGKINSIFFGQNINKNKVAEVSISDKDIFLISYPKSGNTWIRFIIANLIKSEPNEIIDFHSAIKYVPELGVHNKFLSKLSSPRFIKSHQLFNEKFKNIVYIVRDPRDVYVSYYHYLKNRLSTERSFSDFLRNKELYPCRWHSHVESWIYSPNTKLVIRYEDMLLNPYEQISNLLDFVGVEKFSSDEIARAIDNSSFANMAKIEQERGRPFLSESDKRKSTTFVRKGVQGDWKNFFSESDEDFLLREAGHVMKRFGYI